MFTTFFSLSLLALAQSVLAQYGSSIDTPTFVQCQSTQITWTSTGNPPYDLLIVPANDPCGHALEDLGNQTSTSMNWTVNIAAGTQVVLSLMDAVGNEAWSGTVTVANSNNTSCLTTTSPSPTSSVPGNAHPGGVATPSTTSTTSSHPTSSTFAPAGAAGAGAVHSASVLSTRPLSAVTLLGSAVLVVVAFTL
ncbi:hypothetical protein JVT61DRAFT_4440 [Boletus reticuloceps]|uniref:Uncharacterized protein n=1 Tax=Boletus reticuloceps TaxID=495285 RepID=A0A8I3A8X3_9AGAM|nr:hypothetical protein JVT61DRAFT_4440 [Boletus reticuloceps]